MVTVWNYIKHKGPNSCDSKWSLTFFPPDTTSSLCLTHAAPIQTIFFAAKLSYLTGFLFSSGSLAVTIPTCVPTLVSSFTSIIAPSGGWKIGGSSMSDTLTRTMVWSRKEPRSTKRGSTCLFTASTTTLCVRLLSKSSVWRNKERFCFNVTAIYEKRHQAQYWHRRSGISIHTSRSSRWFFQVIVVSAGPGHHQWSLE